MEFADYLAKREGMEAIRLDVGVDNLPAKRLYEKHGSELIDKVDLGYGEYGLPWFNLFEKIL